jgi:hypothetical protein
VTVHEVSVTQGRRNGALRQLEDGSGGRRSLFGGGYREHVDDSSADLTPVDRRPWRRLGAGLAVLESLPLIGLAGLYLGELVTSRATVVRNAVMLVVLLGAVGVGLLVVARGLLAGRRWARSPAVTWQILLLAIAWYVVSSGHLLAGVGVVAVAVVTAVAAVRGTPAED